MTAGFGSGEGIGPGFAATAIVFRRLRSEFGQYGAVSTVTVTGGMPEIIFMADGGDAAEVHDARLASLGLDAWPQSVPPGDPAVATSVC